MCVCVYVCICVGEGEGGSEGGMERGVRGVYVCMVCKCVCVYVCGVYRRCVMSQSNQKGNVIWLHAMNFIIEGKVWFCHASVACLSDNVMRKRNIYKSIQEEVPGTCDDT